MLLFLAFSWFEPVHLLNDPHTVFLCSLVWLCLFPYLSHPRHNRIIRSTRMSEKRCQLYIAVSPYTAIIFFQTACSEYIELLCHARNRKHLCELRASRRFYEKICDFLWKVRILFHRRYCTIVQPALEEIICPGSQ